MGTGVLLGSNITDEERDALISELTTLGSKLPKPLTERTMVNNENTQLRETTFDSEVQRAVSKFISSCPSSTDVGNYLAFCANYYCVSIEKTPQWVELSKYYEFRISDFVNDTEFIADKLGETSLNKVLPFWVYRGNQY